MGNVNQGDRTQSKLFNTAEIKNTANADKLFMKLLVEIEKREMDPYKEFTISEIVDIIPIGTAGVDNHSTYGFSITSMFGGQRGREYFNYITVGLRDEFTEICRDPNRDNYYWKKKYLNERCKINEEFIKNIKYL